MKLFYNGAYLPSVGGPLKPSCQAAPEYFMQLLTMFLFNRMRLLIVYILLMVPLLSSVTSGDLFSIIPLPLVKITRLEKSLKLEN